MKAKDIEIKCQYCIPDKLDAVGEHAVVCHKRGDNIARHNGIRYRVATAC